MVATHRNRTSWNGKIAQFVQKAPVFQKTTSKAYFGQAWRRLYMEGEIFPKPSENLSATSPAPLASAREKRYNRAEHTAGTAHWRKRRNLI